MAKRQKNTVVAVMKVAEKAYAVEVVCLVSDNRSIHLSLNSGTAIGYKAYKKNRDLSSSELGEKLSEMISTQQIGGNAEYDKANYDRDTYLQELKVDVGGVY